MAPREAASRPRPALFGRRHHGRGRQTHGREHALADEPVLRVSAIPDEAPTELQRKFKPLGDYLAQKLGMKVEFTPVTSQNRIPLVMNGMVDLECGSTTNNTARRKDVEFAINHFYTGTRLLVKKSSKIKDYADLAKKTVASTTGTTNFQVLRKYNADKNLEMNIILGKDHADSMLLVESDRAVAFAMDDILLYGLMGNARNPADFEVVGESLQVEPYACMLRKDDPAFKQLVDGTIANLMKSGEFEKLYTKWFMQSIPPKGVPVGLPMSPQLRDNIKAPNDRPAT